ncbi:MAG: hypothetical protein HC790_07020 [Acaryochloridaceae cyanobacterium CSU_3_4]|nr:hypothetical protein [Acaryochloris sp. SU_5_25]NJN38525.1 hypothetical protein [Acaryochloridaceae cyanobacterium CSU_3_4]
MRKFDWIVLGLSLAMAPTLCSAVWAQQPLPSKPVNPPAPMPKTFSAVKGDCGKEQTCTQLLQTLQAQWPQAKLSCSRDRILSMQVVNNAQGSRQVHLICWDAVLKKGDRYGLTHTFLPYPGNEIQFLPTLPKTRSDYKTTLTSRYPDQIRKSQTECGLLGGYIQFQERQDIDQLELQCVFTASAILIDTDRDFVSDGEASQGTTIDKIVGKFSLAELKKPLASAQVQPTPPTPELPPTHNTSVGTANSIPVGTNNSSTVSTSDSTRQTLAAIDVQIFDRIKNQLVSLEQRWNPYGLGMDLFITVKVNPVSGAQTIPPGTNLVLAINAASYNTPATGSVPPWNLVQTRPLSWIGNEQLSHAFPFLAEYRCYPQVQLTATLLQPGQSAGPSLTKTLNLSCAE